MQRISECLKEIVILKEDIHKIKFSVASEQKKTDVNILRSAKKGIAKLRREITELIKKNKELVKESGKI